MNARRRWSRRLARTGALLAIAALSLFGVLAYRSLDTEAALAALWSLCAAPR